LISFKDFIDGLRNLYDTGNISRTSYTEAFEFNYEEEANKLKEEKTLIKELGIDPVAPSNKPGTPQPGTPQSGSKPTT
jgi:hypothetical protein